MKRYFPDYDRMAIIAFEPHLWIAELMCHDEVMCFPPCLPHIGTDVDARQSEMIFVQEHKILQEEELKIEIVWLIKWNLIRLSLLT
jgi:hypothetical protein